MRLIFFKPNRNRRLPNTEKIQQTKNYYNKIYSKPYPVEKYNEVYKIVCTFLEKFSNKDSLIMDIGCGAGGLAALIKDNGYKNYYGFDYSQNAINQSKKRIPEWEDRFFIHDCYKLSKLDINFEIGIATEVLEHLEDLKILNQLKPSQLFIGSVPNYWAANNAHLRIYPSKFFILYALKNNQSRLAPSNLQFCRCVGNSFD